jgi:hypothetical protein
MGPVQADRTTAMSKLQMSTEVCKTMHPSIWLHSLVSSTKHIVSEVRMLYGFDQSAATDLTAMPDLQYAASQNDVMVGLRDHVLPARCK